MKTFAKKRALTARDIEPYLFGRPKADEVVRRIRQVEYRATIPANGPTMDNPDAEDRTVYLDVPESVRDLIIDTLAAAAVRELLLAANVRAAKAFRIRPGSIVRVDNARNIQSGRYRVTRHFMAEGRDGPSRYPQAVVNAVQLVPRSDRPEKGGRAVPRIPVANVRVTSTEPAVGWTDPPSWKGLEYGAEFIDFTPYREFNAIVAGTMGNGSGSAWGIVCDWIQDRNAFPFGDWTERGVPYMACEAELRKLVDAFRNRVGRKAGSMLYPLGPPAITPEIERTNNNPV